MSDVHEHLEQAEHAQHAAFSTFDRKVAVTIAIIAAALAGVSVLGHRAHNEVLSLQAESNRLRTEAAAAQVEASNQFAWYQAKRLRQAQAESFLKLSGTLPALSGRETARSEAEATWTKDIAKYAQELPDMEVEGKKRAERAKDLDQQAEGKLHEAHFVHRQANRLDISHFAVQLGLILASIAVLTKRRAFWFSGIAACLIGLTATGSAYLMSPHADETSVEHADSHKDAKPAKGEHQ